MAIIRGDMTPAKSFEDQLGRSNSDPVTNMPVKQAGYDGMKWLDQVTSEKPSPSTVSGNTAGNTISNPY